MRYALAIVLLISVCVVACSPQQPTAMHAHKTQVSTQHVPKAEVIAATKHLSAAACAPHDANGIGFAGCDYIALFADNQWNVTVVHYSVVNGKRAYAQGGNSYVFDAKGTLVRVVGGM